MVVRSKTSDIKVDAMDQSNWIFPTLCLCAFGFMKDLKPYEPFLTPYLNSTFKNITRTELTDTIYPVSTYSYFGFLLLVFLLTDFLRYKPLIVLESCASLATRGLLVWGQGVKTMQLMQVLYGVAGASEIAYYSYIYAVVPQQHYQRVTAHTRAVVLFAKGLSGILAQVLVSGGFANYLHLNYISFCSAAVALAVSLCLPQVNQNIFGLSESSKDAKVPRDILTEDSTDSGKISDEDSTRNAALDNNSLENINNNSRENLHEVLPDNIKGTANEKLKICSLKVCKKIPLDKKENPRNSCSLSEVEKQKTFLIEHSLNTISTTTETKCGRLGTSLRLMISCVRKSYSSRELVKWSSWWILATCGGLQVRYYVMNLWAQILGKNSKLVYNGAVFACGTLLSAFFVALLSFVRVEWNSFPVVGELVIGMVSLGQCVMLLIMAHTENVLVAYICFVVFRISFALTVTLASYQIAVHVEKSGFAFVFGCNTFVALALQCLMTFVVADKKGLNLDERNQFVVYGCYFGFITFVFLCRPTFVMLNRISRWTN